VVKINFLWLYFLGWKRCIDENHHNNNYSTFPKYKVLLGVVAIMVVVYFLWVYFVCSYYATPGENFKTKAWERICRKQILFDKCCSRIHELFISTPWIAPTGGTIIEVKIHSSTMRVVVSKQK
jgi:hypothetical protein